MTDFIEQPVSTTVTLGSSAYPSPLYIAGPASILPAKDGTDGITLSPGAVIGGFVTNYGYVRGGYGFPANNGGNGVDLPVTSEVTNMSSGTITGARGGDGVSITSIGFLNAGAGGDGIILGNGSGGENFGTVSGGYGGNGYQFSITMPSIGNSSGGDGGAGVILGKTNNFFNAGTIAGGNGGSRIAFGPNGNAGDGGIGAAIGTGSDVRNSGVITGGAGGSGSGVDAPGAGGIGVVLANNVALLTNEGTITGGKGAYGENGNKSAAGGAGVYEGFGSYIINASPLAGITGGIGSAAGIEIADQGNTGVVQTKLRNFGIITGGQAAYADFTGTANNGGAGIDININAQNTAAIQNAFFIIGGAGGTEGAIGSAGGTGGAGIFLEQGDVSIVDQGTILGGVGGLGTGFGSNVGKGGTGGFGVDIQNGATLVSNNNIYGGIGGDGDYGIFGNPGGPAGNGGAGVYLNGGTLVETAGVISGGAGGKGDGGAASYTGPIGQTGYAVQFGKNASRLVIDPGVVFDGIVAANPFTSDILELAANGSTGNLSGLGSQIEFFSGIIVDSGATWNITGPTDIGVNQFVQDDGNLTFNGTVKNDGPIYLDPATVTFESAVTGDGTIQIGAGSNAIFNGSVSSTETIDFLSNTGTLTLNDPANFDGKIIGEGTTITAPCFAAGTYILTPRGELRVEDLAVGDIVITREGDDVPIQWIGRRKIDLTRHRQPEKARPIRFDAECFRDNEPYEALTLSPDHGLYIKGNLIPAKALENGLNICQLNPASVIYYHIELSEHAIIFANGVAVESYLETCNRSAFENGGGAVTLHPDFANFQAMREAKSCVPFTEDGLTVGNIRAKILSRWWRRAAPKGMDFAAASRWHRERRRNSGQ